MKTSKRIILVIAFLCLFILPSSARAYQLNTSGTTTLSSCLANGTTTTTLTSPSGWAGRWLVTASNEQTFFCQGASCASGGYPIGDGGSFEIDSYSGAISCRSAGGGGSLVFTPVAGKSTPIGAGPFPRNLRITTNNTYLRLDATGSDDGVGVGKMLVCYRRNDTGGALPAGWEVGCYIDSQGAYRTNQAITLSGNIGPAAADGIYTINPPVNEGTWPAMQYIWSDVPYGIINRSGLSGVNNATYVSMSDSGSFTMAVMNAPRIRLGVSASPLTLDSYIEWTSNLHLHTNARWDVDLGGSYGGRLDLSGGLSTNAIYDGNLVNVLVPEAGNVRVIPTAAQVAAVPTAPATCNAAHEGAIAFKDDTNDAAAAFLCFCGKGADDSTYGWRQADSRTTICF